MEIINDITESDEETTYESAGETTYESAGETTYESAGETRKNLLEKIILRKAQQEKVERFTLPRDMKKFREECRKIRFGIEIETCYNMDSYKERYFKDINLLKSFKTKTSFFINDMNEEFEMWSKKYKEEADELVSFLDFKIGDVGVYKEEQGSYDMWTITDDDSINCDVKAKALINNICLKNDINLECKKLSVPFIKTEIVSPVLSMNGRSKKSYSIGEDILHFIFFGFLLDNQKIFFTNSSQGIHVNISYIDDENTEKIKYKFAQSWYVFEPIIFQFMNKYRRENTEWSPLITNEFDNMDYNNFLTLSKDKYHSINFKNKGRIEVRLHHASMNFIEINNWILFCVLFLASSIHTNTSDLKKYREKDNIQLFKYLFTDYVPDVDLLTYYQEKYNSSDVQIKIPRRTVNIQKKVFNKIYKKGSSLDNIISKLKDVYTVQKPITDLI